MLRSLVLLLLVAASRAAQDCCPDIGCFTDDPPFDGLPLPWCMGQINPTYEMFTRSNRLIGQFFDHTSVPSVFQPALRTVFIVHGYQGDGGNTWMAEMKDAFLDREDINVVLLGWAGGADILNYLQAASNTRSTGAYSAVVIDNLVLTGGGAYSRFWCVGHSLGSHVCGHLGMTSKIGRITGMDPAGPSFESSSDLMIGLNPTCADYVDVIHTDSQTYGTLRTLGHIDFYPEGGHDQPSCGPDATSCSHFRAVQYMTESVRQDCFEATSQCSDYNLIPLSCSLCTCGLDPCAYLGYAADTSCQRLGIYELNIALNDPWCTG